MRVDLGQPLPTALDVIVIGGGPGGASAGLAAARLGLRVLILERTCFPRHRLGETLPPKILPVLSFLGLLPAVEAAGFRRMNGNANLLGGQLVNQPFTPDGRGFGFQVERERFDSILLEAAEREGCAVAEEASVCGLLRAGSDGVEPPRGPAELAASAAPGIRGVLVRRPGRPVERIEASYVIDASGAACLIARELDLRRNEELRTIALWAYWVDTAEPTDFASANTVLEATREGWIWSLPLSDGRRNVSCGVAAETVRPRALTERYDEVVGTSRLLAPLLRAARRTGPPKGYDASWYSSERYAGPGFLLVGEAASFIDPLTSQGVIKAMNSGVLAAAVANTAIRRSADRALALEFFDASERETFERYRRSALLLYRSAAPEGSPFWQARGRSHEILPDSPELTEEERTALLDRFLEQLRTVSPSRLCLSLRPELRIEMRPCLVGGFVERRPALVDPRAPLRPHHYSVELKVLVPLLDGRDLDAVFESYASETGMARTPESGRALSLGLGRLVEDGLLQVSVS